MQKPLVAIVMAAGKGTRMKSDLPKVLHAIAGVPLLGHVLHRLEALAAEETYVIVGHGADQVRSYLAANLQPDTQPIIDVEQREQLGTGHAVDQVTPHLNHFDGEVLILSGDVPLLTSETLAALRRAHSEAGATLSLLTTRLPDPTGYGRVLRDAKSQVTGIVEHKDASPEQRAVNEVNLGTYLCAWAPLREALKSLTPNNAQGEYYLTDAIAYLVSAGHPVASHVTADPLEGAGVNTRLELATLTAEYNRRTNRYWMSEGVTFLQPDTTSVGPYVTLGPDTIVEGGVTILGKTTIGARCLIGAHSHLSNMTLGDEVEVLNSHLTDSTLGDGTHVGPYARLRERCMVGRNVRLGNFVELKKATLGDGTKAAHLAYLGDATIGRKVNIGCGVITVNYDGSKKHPTHVEDGAFVGSNSNLIAPVTVHENGYVAAGSTITDDVPAGALAVGRGRQVNKEGWVAKRRGGDPVSAASGSNTAKDKG